MSGGVDSSVAALLLQRAGYDVVGITFQLYDYARANREGGKGGCCSLEDVSDAREVCHRLGIQHFLVDSRERFKKRVVDYFTETYRQGLTPNPCVACNTFIKFDELDEYRASIGADFIATGHYVDTEKRGDRLYLKAAKDPLKDQSYFLVGMKRSFLDKALFPIAPYTKDEVRTMAESAGMPISTKRDSMEICFIPQNDYRHFLKTTAGFADVEGEIVNRKGEVLGKHRGFHHFTIGQKKGLADFGIHHHYVASLEAHTNRVIVDRDEGLFQDSFWFQAIDREALSEHLKRPLQVKVRSRSKAVCAQITELKSDGSGRVEFEEAQRALSPGQFAVFYDGDLLVGGGPILKRMSEFSHGEREGEPRKNSETPRDAILEYRAS